MCEAPREPKGVEGMIGPPRGALPFVSIIVNIVPFGLAIVVVRIL